MSVWWEYFWPCFAAGLVAGLLGGVFGWRRPRRHAILTVALALAIGAAGLWHGPLGAADRFTAKVERMSREALDYYEMTQVSAHLHRGPLTRRLILKGPANDFQTAELARLFSQVPGVSRAQWTERGAGLPLIVEAMLAALLGFLFGLLLAYLVELHRRYNAQWNW